jgi:flagellar secretion chaperone FliS
VNAYSRSPNAYAKSADAYLSQRVLGASPEQQAALIMEAGQLHLGRAIHALSLNDAAGAARSFTRVSDVIAEATLRLNLKDGGELAQNLEKLYGWWAREILAANDAKELARLKVVMTAMGEIRQAWEQLHEKQVQSAKPSPSALDRVV